MNIRLRPARKQHAELLTAIQVEAFSDQVKQYDFPPPGYDSVEYQIESMKKYRYFVIQAGGEIVGGAIVNRLKRNVCYLLRIFIHSAWQAKGLGTQTMRLLEKKFPFVKEWQLDTPYLSYQNQRFYEKLGYQKIGETEKENNGFFCLIYKKRVS